MEIRALRESDDRSQLQSCDLDRFFHRFAGQNQFKRYVRVTYDYGCAGVVVDAKVDAVDFYAKYGFITVDAVEGQSDARPQPAAMFLSMRAIKGGSA